MPTELPIPLENDQPGYYFPGFIPRIWKNRTLAFFDGVHLIHEGGGSCNPGGFYDICG